MAVEAYKKALEIEPGHATACNNMAATLLRQGKIAEAINGYQEAVAVRPDYVIAHSNLLLAYNYQNHKDPEWLFSRHRNWAEAHVLSEGDNPFLIRATVLLPIVRSVSDIVRLISGLIPWPTFLKRSSRPMTAPDSKSSVIQT